MRDNEDDSIYEFWSKLPGPGEFSSDAFASIPMKATVWEGVKLGVSEYLGEAEQGVRPLLNRTDTKTAKNLRF